MPSPLCEEKYQYGLVMGKRAENVDGLLSPNKSHIYHGDINIFLIVAIWQISHLSLSYKPVWFAL
ncbi:hypothetical protein KW586_001946 [Escherichia coli]|uniref:Uncharacterized protein n=1 Tax=Escherichia coli TaxID=562 RepID=A0A2A6Q168_ECOLX|nr:hypothetical protein [Escherichia coli]EHQ5528615.1 hypothetical protein [Escherichia coli O2]EIG81129.1 hypothetical protein EC12741_3032 [Escherichia coli 1.2741]BDI38395.1 hypothetical protein EsCdI10290_04462 [Escherichia sp. 10290]BDI43340.1 hypothetical protein EsCd1HHP024_04400 [Escherichia sp. HH091_1A]BDI48220.1 hypothetical protein EsCd1HHP049_04319 [Escherichia sp. HH154_1D]